MNVLPIQGILCLMPHKNKDGTWHTSLSHMERVGLEIESGMDLSPDSEYWRDTVVKVYGNSIYLNEKDPIDKIKYSWLKVHPDIKKFNVWLIKI